MTRAVALAVAMAATLAACAPAAIQDGGETAPDTTITADATASGTSVTSDTTPATATETDTTPETATETAPSTTKTPPPDSGPAGPLFVEGTALATMLLQAPTTGAGSRPLLQWDAVAGVDTYMVFVFDPDGAPYWSWATTDTEVVVGGVESDDPILPGPRIWTELTWTVIGVDDGGVPIAQSELRPIAP